MTTTFTRSPAFANLEDLLDWSQRYGVAAPVVEMGHDGTYRGSVSSNKVMSISFEESVDGDIEPEREET